MSSPRRTTSGLDGRPEDGRIITKRRLKSITFPGSTTASIEKPKCAPSKFTIDYSPVSNFMKGLRDEGQIARAILNTRNKQITPENPTIKKFRRKCCSKKKTSDAGVRKRMSCSSVELKNVKAFRAKNRTVKSDENPSHTCHHEYQLNSRLLPQPLLSSPAGQSMCRLCRLPLNHASSSKHFLLTTEGTQEIPDPYEFKPKLRPLKHRLIAEAPTLSYIPHFRQRVGKLLRP